MSTNTTYFSTRVGASTFLPVPFPVESVALGIAHFFLWEVWFWWGAQRNLIIRERDRRKGGS